MEVIGSDRRGDDRVVLNGLRTGFFFSTKRSWMDIHLNFINYSDDTNNSSVVIFQKNVADPFDHSVIAWEVISNYGPGVKIPFVFHLR